MVLQLHIDPNLTQSLKEEVDKFRHLLYNYSDIQAEPKVLMLRNPSVSTAAYDSWQNNYRYGKNTCPSIHVGRVEATFPLTAKSEFINELIAGPWGPCGPGGPCGPIGPMGP